MHESDSVPVTSRAELLRLAGTFPWLPPLEVGTGWAALLWDMAEDLEDLFGRSALIEGRAGLHEIRARHGCLRIAGSKPAGWEPRQEEGLRVILGRAEERAACTCERCGRRGTTAVHNGRWTTLCIWHHAAAAERARRPGSPLRGV